MAELHALRLDREGRVVIPAAVRRQLFWGPGTPVVVTSSGFDQVTIARAEAIATRSRLARAVADAMEADDAERVAILAEQLEHADAMAADARTAAWQAAGWRP